MQKSMWKLLIKLNLYLIRERNVSAHIFMQMPVWRQASFPTLLAAALNHTPIEVSYGCSIIKHLFHALRDGRKQLKQRANSFGFPCTSSEVKPTVACRLPMYVHVLHARSLARVRCALAWAKTQHGTTANSPQRVARTV